MKQCGSYRLKLQTSKGYFLISSTSISTCLKFRISYNPICNGRAGQGAFFFWCKLADSPFEMWYDTSCMTSLSKENFGKRCRGFSALYIRMKVPDGEACQSTMSINASIAAFNMQGGSCSNIILYTCCTTKQPPHL